MPQEEQRIAERDARRAARVLEAVELIKDAQQVGSELIANGWDPGAWGGFSNEGLMRIYLAALQIVATGAARSPS